MQTCAERDMAIGCAWDVEWLWIGENGRMTICGADRCCNPRFPGNLIFTECRPRACPTTHLLDRARIAPELFDGRFDELRLFPQKLFLVRVLAKREYATAQEIFGCLISS